MDYVYWSIAILLVLAGLVGSVVPLLPGTTLILLGVLGQKWLLPGTITWSVVGWVAGFWLLSVVVDIVCTLIGTRLFGGGKWGMAGAAGGALAGMFISFPALVLGTLFGAMLAEKWLGKRTTDDSLKAGTGAAAGFLLSFIPKVSCALVMTGLYAWALWNALPRKPGS